MTEEWKPDKYTTRCCGSTIWSAYPGQYKECTCGESFVDQTHEYTRLGGSGLAHYYIEDKDE